MTKVMKQITVEVEQNDFKRLDQFAKRSDQKRSWAARRTINAGLTLYESLDYHKIMALNPEKTFGQNVVDLVNSTFVC